MCVCVYVCVCVFDGVSCGCRHALGVECPWVWGVLGVGYLWV